jgi:hypothetical protein
MIQRSLGLLAVPLLVMGFAVDTRADDLLCSTPPFATTKTGATVTITIDWNKLNTCVTKEPKNGLGNRIADRINEGDIVKIHVVNFNFVNYTVAYKIEETVVESYVMLEKLFSQLLGLPFLAGPTGELDAQRAPCKGFQECAGRWAFAIATTNITLGKFVSESAHKTHIDDNGKAVASHAKVLVNARQTITAAMDAIMNNSANQPATPDQVNLFETIYGKQEKLFEKLDAYAAAADLVANGQVRHLGKKKAGTIVAVSMTPKNQAQADGRPSVTAEYFVHSRLPVVFHAGYTYARFQDVKVETVRGLEQTDLFSEVRSNSKAVRSMAAFLSLGRSFLPDEKVGVYFSVGTDFSKPGDRLYLGGSLQLYKRFFITGGLASVKTEEGVNPIVAQIGDTLQTRELFTAVATHRDWNKGFYAVSFRVF